VSPVARMAIMVTGRWVVVLHSFLIDLLITREFLVSPPQKVEEQKKSINKMERLIIMVDDREEAITDKLFLKKPYKWIWMHSLNWMVRYLGQKKDPEMQGRKAKIQKQVEKKFYAWNASSSLTKVREELTELKCQRTIFPANSGNWWWSSHVSTSNRTCLHQVPRTILQLVINHFPLVLPLMPLMMMWEKFTANQFHT